MVVSFTNLVKPILKSLSAHDYPVLNSCLFFEIWLNFLLDNSLTSMRGLFYRLNHTSIKVDISTFSKACKSREDHKFYMKTNFEPQRYRVAWFCDLEDRTEYRLATNLIEMSKEEISEIYRKHWESEGIWKFLKMHIKLDKLITKNETGVTLPILMVLIADLLLQLMEVHQFYG